MPWNECKPMDERLRFVARLLEGEQMAPLCREFGISRVTGYKIFGRYRNAAWMASMIEAGGPIGMPISCPSRSSAAFSASSMSIPLGERRRFATG